MGATKEEIAQLVKTSRLARGYTQQQLADLVGITLRSVQRIEGGEVLPRYYTLKLLAQHLHFSAEVLRDNSDDKTERPKTKKRSLIQRIVLTVIGLAVTTLLAGAFIAQSAHFPETQFELFLFLAIVIAAYGLVLYRIWR